MLLLVQAMISALADQVKDFGAKIRALPRRLVAGDCFTGVGTCERVMDEVVAQLNRHLAKCGMGHTEDLEATAIL